MAMVAFHGLKTASTRSISSSNLAFLLVKLAAACQYLLATLIPTPTLWLQDNQQGVYCGIGRRQNYRDFALGGDSGEVSTREAGTFRSNLYTRSRYIQK